MRAAAVTGSENGTADGATSDPWFAPGPKVFAAGDAPESADGAAYLDSAGAVESAGAAEPGTAARQLEAAADHAATAEWFLPTGRAGLLPESMTVSSEDDESGEPRPEYPAPTQPAGAPPWAGEVSGPATGTPPPWETGPWPGPGGDRTSLKADALARGRAAANGWPGPAGTGQRSPGQQQASGLSAGTILVFGLVPLVIPGLVAGVFGFRRSPSGGPVRRASILAIAASLAWAVIIVVLVASNSGGSAGRCVYPASVHQAYTQVTADLSAHPGAAKQLADLGVALSRANASAAATATGDISVRSALFALAGDLQQARADLTGGRRAVPASLRARLAADGTALTAACPS